MKTIDLAGGQLPAPSLISGQMRINQMSPAEIRAMTDAALAAGITMFDHADIYGGSTHFCEDRWASALELTPGARAELILQTKTGIRKDGGTYFDFSAEHIEESVNGSLTALRTDYLDVLLLHRPDALMEPDEIAGAFDQLSQKGKVRHFGVSNFTPWQIELLQRSVNQPLVANQIQLSITHCPTIGAGLASNMAGLDQSIERGAGLVEYCQLHSITLQAWSPFQAGFFTGSFLGDLQNWGPLNQVLDRLAAHYQVEPIAIATAWILRHPANMQVVLGTTDRSRITAAAAGSQIQLTRSQWYELVRAANYTVP